MEALPSVLTDWQHWCAAHPESTVPALPVRGRERGREAWPDLHPPEP